MKRNIALTKQQRLIIQLVARGFSNRGIAERLGTTEGTVKAQVHLLLLQLNANNRTALVVTAQRMAVA